MNLEALGPQLVTVLRSHLDMRLANRAIQSEAMLKLASGVHDTREKASFA